MTWGDSKYGGDSSTVQQQLKQVRRVQAITVDFAAILQDGSRAGVADPSHASSLCSDPAGWIRRDLGNQLLGGDSSTVQGQLKQVQQIQATDLAFQRSCRMDPSRLGVTARAVVTAAPYRSGSSRCNRSKARKQSLQRSCRMDPS